MGFIIRNDSKKDLHSLSLKCLFITLTMTHYNTMHQRTKPHNDEMGGLHVTRV